MSKVQHYQQILKRFPPVQYAFAYGSGAHHQPGLYDANSDAAPSADTGRGTAGAAAPKGIRKPVLDFIFAVKDVNAWHEQNIAQNRDHYSWVAGLGHNTVCAIQEAVGVGVHFNTLVQLDAETVIKYGVVQEDKLQQDLEMWTQLYLAGRMQKPITPLVLPMPPLLAQAQAANLRGALAAALLLLPHSFTTRQLLEGIVGLSYRGDIRQRFAEDPHKVSRIAAGSHEALARMYLPLLVQRYSGTELELQLPPSLQQPLSAAALASTMAAINTAADGQQEHRQRQQQEDASSTSTSSSSGGGLQTQHHDLTSSNDILHSQQQHDNFSGANAIGIGVGDADALWSYRASPEAKRLLVSQLPAGLLADMARKLGYHVPLSHLQPGLTTHVEVVEAAMRSGHPAKLASDSLEGIVRQSSIYQAMSGFLAAGGGKAMQYVAAKVQKAWSAGAPAVKHLATSAMHKAQQQRRTDATAGKDSNNSSSSSSSSSSSHKA